MTQNIKMGNTINNSMWPFKKFNTQRQFSISVTLIAGAILLLHSYFPSKDLAYIVAVVIGTIGLVYTIEGIPYAPI